MNNTSRLLAPFLTVSDPEKTLNQTYHQLLQTLQSLNHYLTTLSTSLLYHTKTLYLFTRSDLKTIVFPSTLFALTFTSSLLLSSSPSSPSSSPSWTWPTLTSSLLSTIFWIWINLLPFTIENQRQPGSIVEDASNKPWRPLPSKRLTPSSAAALTAVTYSAAIIASLALGGSVQCGALIVLGAWYNNNNDRAKGSLILRNVLNGAGYVCFTSGALEVMTSNLGMMEGGDGMMMGWVEMIGGIVASSIHVMDIPDRVGDEARGRRTIPLVYGDGAARWSVAIAIGAGSVCCSVFWELGLMKSGLHFAIGAVVVARILGKKTVEEDKKTSLLYNVWIAALFCLPLLKNL